MLLPIVSKGGLEDPALLTKLRPAPGPHAHVRVLVQMDETYHTPSRADRSEGFSGFSDFSDFYFFRNIVFGKCSFPQGSPGPCGHFLL